MKLLKVDKVGEAREKIMRCMEGRTGPMSVSLEEAAGLTAAEDVKARDPVPAFARSSVDGYAVRSRDISGASENLPALLKARGEVVMGEAPRDRVGPGTCMYIPTGGMMPEGADAVVMVEYCESFAEDGIAVYSPAGAGASVVMPGDDMEPGDVIVSKGSRLRPQDIGALAAAGVTEVDVFRPWSISIFSTGDELVDPSEVPGPGQVRDVNTCSLSAMAEQRHLRVVRKEVLKDDRDLLAERMAAASEDSDIVLVSGGSSKGRKDETASVIDELTGGGVFTRGIAMKPGKPAVFGYDGGRGTLFAGLPGHPAAAVMVFEMIIGYVRDRLTSVPEQIPLSAAVTSSAAAAPGRATCLMVRLSRDGEGGLLADPVPGRSGMMSILAGSDGYVVIGEDEEGLRAGGHVDVYRF